jgi:trans-aconitate methyltransferase
MNFPYAFFDPDEYRELLERSGLEPVRVELLRKEMAQPGREGLAGWIRTTWLPFTERVPPDLREEFVSAIVERFAEIHPPDEGGVLRLEMKRLEVEARRP